MSLQGGHRDATAGDRLFSGAVLLSHTMCCTTPAVHNPKCFTRGFVCLIWWLKARPAPETTTPVLLILVTCYSQRLAVRAKLFAGFL